MITPVIPSQDIKNMLADPINELPPEVFYDILKVLEIDVGEFIYRLLNDNPEEVVMYVRIYLLYEQTKIYKKQGKIDNHLK